jgi:acyl-CoA dehydrogenase
MDFAASPRSRELTEAVRSFVHHRVLPVEDELHRQGALERSLGVAMDSWVEPAPIAELRRQARDEGLWNLFLPEGHGDEWAQRFGTRDGRGLSNVDYAPVAEAMGWSFMAPYVMNSNAPDSGNAEVLLKYGSTEQQEQWLAPLLDGRIRSAFAMTEPGVASSDATTMELTAAVEGDEVVLNGRKWWTTGIGHPD